MAFTWPSILPRDTGWCRCAARLGTAGMHPKRSTKRVSALLLVSSGILLGRVGCERARVGADGHAVRRDRSLVSGPEHDAADAVHDVRDDVLLVRDAARDARVGLRPRLEADNDLRSRDVVQGRLDDGVVVLLNEVLLRGILEALLSVDVVHHVMNEVDRVHAVSRVRHNILHDINALAISSE